MRKIRIAVVAVFLLSAIAYGWLTLFADRGKDTTPPTIQCSQDTLQLSVEDDESKLLEGITAQDNVDGDLTAAIRVSALSRFAAQGRRTVDYVVFDSANNFATYSRTVQYTDYQPPRIWLDEPLRVDINQLEKFDPSASLRAEDVLDGDISNKVRVSVNSGAYVGDAGNYPITAQVSNSAGDTVTVPLEMTVIDHVAGGGGVQLVVHADSARRAAPEGELVPLVEHRPAHREQHDEKHRSREEKQKGRAVQAAKGGFALSAQRQHGADCRAQIHRRRAQSQRAQHTGRRDGQRAAAQHHHRSSSGIASGALRQQHRPARHGAQGQQHRQNGEHTAIHPFG